jgi:hypothetical protein
MTPPSPRNGREKEFAPLIVRTRGALVVPPQFVTGGPRLAVGDLIRPGNGGKPAGLRAHGRSSPRSGVSGVDAGTAFSPPAARLTSAGSALGLHQRIDLSIGARIVQVNWTQPRSPR